MTGEKRTRPLDSGGEMGGRKHGDFLELKGFSEKIEKPSLLLHSCCGPCSTAVIERLAVTIRSPYFFITRV